MTSDTELTCIELVELVTDYLEGALSARDRQRFEEHLLVCSGCSTHLEQMRATIAATGGLTEDDLPPTMASDLLDAFRGWTRA